MEGEFSISGLFRLVVILCFFYRDKGVRVGDVEWDVFRFFRGKCCFVAATLASSANRDDVVDRISGMVLGGMGSKWKPFIFDGNPENRLFIINWDHNYFVVNVDGIEGLSWLPSGPVELDIEVSTLDKGAEEVELIVVGIHVDKGDSIIGTQGEDSRGSKSCAGEFIVD